MRAIEDAIEAAEDKIRHLPTSEVRRLRDSMQLPPAGLGDILERSRVTGRITAREFNLIEYFIETWSRHSLSTKMAILARITALSNKRNEWKEYA